MISRVNLFTQVVFVFLSFTFNSFGQFSWTQVADYGGGPSSFTAGGVINGKAYVPSNNQLWEYNPVTNVWNAKANFPGSARVGASSFVINNILYFGTGDVLFGALLKDWWKYDPSNNTWTQLNNFAGLERYAAIGFSIGSKGYIATGFASGFNYLNDIWEYNPASDSWVQKTNLPDAGKYLVGGFSVSGKGYVVTGYEGTSGDVKDVWEFNPVSNSWLQKANFAGVARRQAAGFSSSTNGFLATGGTNTSELTDAWQYNPLTDTWIALPNLPAGGRRSALGFAIDNSVYLGIGFFPSAITYQDFWKLDIGIQLPVELISFTGTATAEGNMLKWSTASEFNNDYFGVERSVDGELFNTIANVDGKGNCISTSDYYFLDTSFPAGANYYRLRQTDFDGTYTYSNTVMLEQTSATYVVSINQNPADETVQLEILSPDNRQITVSMYDVLGTLLLEKNVEVTSGLNQMKIDLPNDVSGMCLIALNSGSNNIHVQKMMLW